MSKNKLLAILNRFTIMKMSYLSLRSMVKSEKMAGF
jgi:hypothetical protein